MANTLGDLVVKIVGDVTEFNKAIDDSNKKFQSATSNFSKLGKGLSAAVTLPILAIGAAAVKSASDMEMMEAQFTTMLGSATKAKSLLKDLSALAAKTPFQLTDLAQGTKTMLAFGIAQEEVLPNLQMLGDIAGGDAEKLKSLTLAFSQIQSTGRLMGQDLLQLINSGFNPLQNISQKTGESMAELKKRMEAGAISAAEVSEAFKSATSEGGLFFGGMERASQTLQGQFSTLLDNVVALGRSIGDVILPVAKDFVATTSEWVEKFTNLDTETKKLIIGFGIAAASIGPLILVILKAKQAIDIMNLSLKLLSGNPVILGLTAVAVGIAVISAGLKQAKIESENLSNSLSGLATLEAMRSSLKLEAAKLADLEARKAEAEARVGKEIVAQRIKEQTAIVNAITKNIGYKELQVKETNRLAAAESKQAQEALDALKAQLAGTVILTEAQEKQLKEEEENLAEALDKEEKAKAQALQDEYDLAWEFTQKNLDRTNAEYDAIVAANKAKNDKIDADNKLAWDLTLQYSLQIYDSLAQIVSTFADNAVATQKEQQTEEIRLLDEKLAAGLVSEEDYKKQKAAIEKAGRMEAYELELKAFKTRQTFALIQIAIDTAMAVAKVWGQTGIAGLIAQAGPIAAGAIQAGVVLAQKPPTKPTFAAGGVVMPQPGGVESIVAEAGKAEAIIPLDRLDQMLARAGGGQASGGMMSLIVNLDSKPLLSKIFDATKNKTVLISAGAVV